MYYHLKCVSVYWVNLTDLISCQSSRFDESEQSFDTLSQSHYNNPNKVSTIFESKISFLTFYDRYDIPFLQCSKTISFIKIRIQQRFRITFIVYSKLKVLLRQHIVGVLTLIKKSQRLHLSLSTLIAGYKSCKLHEKSEIINDILQVQVLDLQIICNYYWHLALL